MSKIYLKELNKILKECNIGKNDDEIDFNSKIVVHHVHDWNHGYEGFFYGIEVHIDGSVDNEQHFTGTRREFYSDLNDVMEFLMEYINYNSIEEMIVAPFFRYDQFDYDDKNNDTYLEIYEFLRKHGIRRGERSGVKLPTNNNRKIIEMIIEGAFRGISQLRILFPSQKALLAPSHHFGLAFFTNDFKSEENIIDKLAGNYDNLRVYKEE